MTTTFPDCATLPIPTLAALAEELCNADKYPQYRGKFDDHVRVRITRNVTTKSGRAFFKGEITIAKRVDYGDGLDWSCVCWRNGGSTLLEDYQVEVLDGLEVSR